MGGHNLFAADYLQVAGAWVLVFALATLFWFRKQTTSGGKRPVATRFTVGVLVLTVATMGAAHVYQAHGSPRVYAYNSWDLFHTVIGGKYLPELGYDRLYECTYRLVLDSDASRVGSSMRDLDSFKMRAPELGISTADCAARFAPERLSQFKYDAGFFLHHHGLSASSLFSDFGYNGTPFHSTLIAVVFHFIHLTHRGLRALSYADDFLITVAALLAYRAFGARGFLATIAIVGLNVADHTVSLFGSFLRHTYVASLVAGMSLLGLKRPAKAAVFFALASVERFFPALFVIAYLVHAARDWIVTKRAPRDAVRFAASYGVTIVACYLVSAAASRGAHTWLACFRRIWYREQVFYVAGIGLKPFFVDPPPIPANLDYLMRYFLQNGSAPRASWAYYPVALCVIALCARALLSRLDRLAFTILFGLVLIFTLTSPIVYYLPMLAVLGAFCTTLPDESHGMRAAFAIALVLGVAHTVQILAKLPYALATAYMSPLMLLLMGTLVLQVVRAQRYRARSLS